MRFIAAVESGAIEQFVAMLSTDVTVTSDSGGKLPPGFAVSRPVHGSEAVSKLLASYVRRAVFPLRVDAREVNGGPGVVIVVDLPVGGGVLGVMSLDIREGKIAALHGVFNPEKLRHLTPTLGPLADLEAVREAERAGRRRNTPQRNAS
ncbi:hypothetical protein ET475_15760 [Microbacterium protaetiae]|uniref:Uncharacterized protein n=1 Tax=Microbacterium protaetiae TaxID=2509458 RepID=A0A4P6EFV7_9MICO|nr:hypothetical protein [Microbacterium protaetiae]QAY61290.1 hypothetical protein ET475_15760 [Microbacterium protaetiae]